jgi:putative Mg2+ transporter-C (MgtC) family protein
MTRTLNELMTSASPFASQLLEAGVALAAAYVLALPLAWERGAHAPLGLRTIPLVSVGACAYVLVSRYLYDQGIYTVDGLARTLRALMTGIGFLAGGAIVKHVRDVRGIATGAAVWNTGAIGASVAHGLYLVALALSLVNVLIFHLSGRLAEHGSSERKHDTAR